MACSDFVAVLIIFDSYFLHKFPDLCNSFSKSLTLGRFDLIINFFKVTLWAANGVQLETNLENWILQRPQLNYRVR